MIKIQHDDWSIRLGENTPDQSDYASYESLERRQ